MIAHSTLLLALFDVKPGAQRLAKPPLRAQSRYLHNCWLGALAAGVEILLHMTLGQLS